MKFLPATDELIQLARRTVWYERPEEVLQRPLQLAMHVMAHGSSEDVGVWPKHLATRLQAFWMSDPGGIGT